MSRFSSGESTVLVEGVHNLGRGCTQSGSRVYTIWVEAVPNVRVRVVRVSSLVFVERNVGGRKLNILVI